jgi:hypothetical protein
MSLASFVCLTSVNFNSFRPQPFWLEMLLLEKINKEEMRSCFCMFIKYNVKVMFNSSRHKATIFHSDSIVWNVF